MQLNLNSLLFFNNISSDNPKSFCNNVEANCKNYALEQNFRAVKDINLYYVLSKRSHLLPDRMVKAVADELNAFNGNRNAKGIRSLLQLHKDTYAQLSAAGTLEEAKKMFPEFSDLIDFSTVSSEFPRLTKNLISKGKNIADFSLDFLKCLWLPTKLEDICKDFGFTTRTSSNKLLKRINMPRYDKNYTILMQSSEEAGNKVFADASKMTPDMCRKYLRLANKANSAPQAREKQARSMKRFYKTCSAERKKLSEIAKIQWSLCEDIRLAQREFLKSQSIQTVAVLAKQSRGEKLTDKEKLIVRAFYKNFWDNHPQYKKTLGNARQEAVRIYNKSKNI